MHQIGQDNFFVLVQNSGKNARKILDQAKNMRTSSGIFASISAIKILSTGQSKYSSLFSPGFSWNLHVDERIPAKRIEFNPVSTKNAGRRILEPMITNAAHGHR
ncbi:hypothetical protein [Undibacterium sp.]|uniref:hypothetical protein n=1 Tax=Undibacterium sp. TaxID=1914977 RepID=UPI00374CF4BC